MLRSLATGGVVAALTLLAATGTAVQTGAAAAPADSVSVVAVGDIACQRDWPGFNSGNGRGSNCRQKWTAQATAAIAPDEVLALGDVQYETGQLSAFRAVFGRTFGTRFLNRTDRADNKLWPVPGNHEYGDDESSRETADGYWAYFNGGTTAKPKKSGVAGRTHQGWYRRQTGAWTVLALNANCDYVACGRKSTQYRWLKRQLRDRGTAPCTLAYWHQPLFTNGLEQPAGYTRLWWRLLDRYDADVVLSGHDHSYQRYPRLNAAGKPDPDGITEFVSGAGGHSLARLVDRRGQPNFAAGSADTTGVLHLELADGSFEWEYVRATYPGNGTFTDTGTDTCV